MKKIVAAFDGLKYSAGTRDFAIHLAKHTSTHLVGVFMDDPTYTSYKLYDLLNNRGASLSKLNEFEKKDKATRNAAADDFAKACQKEKIEYSIHHDRKIAIRDLKHESIYADLLVIDANETLTHYTEKIPTRFVRDLLTDVQCPVILVPAKYKPVKKIVMLYDGGPSAVYAIKMFSYLLHSLKHLPVEVIAVKSMNKDLHLPDNKLMKEFMKRHFPKAVYTILKGIPEAEITNYIRLMKEDVMVVLGAYRRDRVSRWFRESMADVLMKELKLPLFIAHNK